MKQAPDWMGNRQSPRTKAAVVLSGISPAETAARPAAVLPHELFVYKVEVEMRDSRLATATFETQ